MQPLGCNVKKMSKIIAIILGHSAEQHLPET
jgi:hypothetical protein